MKKTIYISVFAIILTLSVLFTACEKSADFANSTPVHRSTESEVKFENDENDSSLKDDLPFEEKTYHFDSYESLYDAIVHPQKTQIGQLMYQESNDYGRKYASMLQAFHKNTIDLLIPEYKNEPASLTNDKGLPPISFFTKELYNLPWIWYRCSIGHENYYVKITYPSVLSLMLPENAQTYLEVISALFPNSPMPNNYEKFESYSAVYEKELTIADKKITSLVLELNESDMVYVQLYINDTFIVLCGNKQLFTNDFFSSFNIVPLKEQPV